MDLNSSPSPFDISEDHDHHPQPNFINSSSSSSVSCHFFFNSTQDQAAYYHQRFYNPQNHHQENEDYYSFHGGSSLYEIKNEVENTGLKLTLWKKEDHAPKSVVPEQKINNTNNNNNNHAKWMSSKMRLIQKMNKPPDRVSLNIITTNTGVATTKHENDPSSSMENELSYNSTSYNCNSPIRVCADCNTTKTPLWRSGPKGPKSLCNACGIRRRKARRAMAAAAAAANGTTLPPDQSPALKIKVQHKEKMPKNGHASHLKKRCKMTTTQAPTGSLANGQKKLGLEDFLINLTKSLNFHCVFPEDERDAAILLMALSSGLVHG